VKNKVSMNKNTLSTSDLSSLIRQIPNKKSLSTYLNIRIYNYTIKGKETGFKRWLKKAFGAEPVILDTLITDNTAKQMNYYLENHGYFYSNVSYTIHRTPDGEKLKKRILRLDSLCINDKGACEKIAKLQLKLEKKKSRQPKRRKAKVFYTIKTYVPYKVRNLTYTISDATIRAFVYSYSSGCRIIPGNIYNIDHLDAERSRITEFLQQNGYFYFSNEYISYTIDSSVNNHELDINLKISNPLVVSPQKSDSLVTARHLRYTVDRVLINTDYNAKTSSTDVFDTLRRIIPARNKFRPEKVYFYLYPGKLKINPRTLAQSVFVDSGDVFNITDVEKTYRNMLDIKLYKYVNITFFDRGDTVNNMGVLDCNIRLTKAPVSAIAVEAEVTNTGGELGISGNLVFQNKNLFRGAEVFSTKIKGAIELQDLFVNKDETGVNSVNSNLKGISFLNTIEAGIDFQLDIPRFLIPIRQEKFPKYFKPKTNINIVYNFQLRLVYTRHFTSGSFGYKWHENEFKTHILTPFQVNLVSILPDSTFQAQIDALRDPILKNTYSNHITTALSYSYIYNTQQINKKKDFFYLRANFEIAGLIFWVTGLIQKKPGSYELLGLPYSQYYRLDADFRYYLYLNTENIFVFRAYSGYGSPLNKNNVLPFDQSFYEGGANSMRAWRLKTLGPGSYSQPDTAIFIDKIGEVAIELNYEYRFPMYKFLKGALFVDVGNIWLRKPNSLYPGGTMFLNSFLSELAFDAGLGIRFDFEYFVIRLDLATTLKDPSLPPGKRWVGQNSNQFKVIGNIGIGYPF
jgi:outer membrane protein assembly factor BamA